MELEGDDHGRSDPGVCGRGGQISHSLWSLCTDPPRLQPLLQRTHFMVPSGAALCPRAVLLLSECGGSPGGWGGEPQRRATGDVPGALHSEVQCMGEPRQDIE